MQPILSALVPVVLLIFVGLFAGQRRWVDAAGSAQISKMCFTLLSPALLFRTMSRIEVQAADLVPVLAYFIAVLALFGATSLVMRRTSQGIVIALSATYSNLVMIGIPLITLAYGQEGLVYLFALLSVHSMILLTLATVSLEWAKVREAKRAGPDAPAPRGLPIVLRALRNSIVNPVVLPIAAGLIWSQTGWTIPPLIDRPLQWMGQAFSPLALLLVGISLAHILDRRPDRSPSPTTASGDQSSRAPGAQAGIALRTTLAISLMKNLLHPLLVAGLCALLGIRGLSAVVIIVAAALPTGATVFMFAQRYGVARDQVASAVAFSTAVALGVLPVAMLAAQWLL